MIRRAVRRGVIVIYAVGLAVMMLMQDDPRAAGRIAYLAMTVTMLVFLGLYVGLASWRSTREGRALVGFMASIAAVLVEASVSAWLGPYPHRLEVRAFLLFGVAVQTAWFTLVLARNLREAKPRTTR